VNLLWLSGRFGIIRTVLFWDDGLPSLGVGRNDD